MRIDTIADSAAVLPDNGVQPRLHNERLLLGRRTEREFPRVQHYTAEAVMEIVLVELRDVACDLMKKMFAKMASA